MLRYICRITLHSVGFTFVTLINVGPFILLKGCPLVRESCSDIDMKQSPYTILQWRWLRLWLWLWLCWAQWNSVTDVSSSLVVLGWPLLHDSLPITWSKDSTKALRINRHIKGFPLPFVFCLLPSSSFSLERLLVWLVCGHRTAHPRHDHCIAQRTHFNKTFIL